MPFMDPQYENDLSVYHPNSMALGVEEHGFRKLGSGWEWHAQTCIERDAKKGIHRPSACVFCRFVLVWVGRWRPKPCSDGGNELPRKTRDVFQLPDSGLSSCSHVATEKKTCSSRSQGIFQYLGRCSPHHARTRSAHQLSSVGSAFEDSFSSWNPNHLRRSFPLEQWQLLQRQSFRARKGSWRLSILEQIVLH